MCDMDTKPTSTSSLPPRLKLLDSSLRIIVIPLGVASLWLTVTNHEENNDYGDLVFSNFTGLKYMAFVTAIASGYAFLGAVSSWVSCLVTKGWIFFVSDQVMAYLVVTSGGAVVETLYLANKGDIEVGWSEACSSYGRFCGKMELALVFHFLAFCCFLVLAVISAYRAFSIFEPPAVPITQLEEA
ncbi:hypothetical protein Dimus_019147 [Dionaea muscipula]